MKITDLAPKDVWHWFAQISQIPRGTFKEQRIMEFIVNFAKERNLEYIQDKQGNVLIKKPMQHMQSKNVVCLQGHSDMVWAKDPSSTINFDTDPIELIVDGEWLRANNTTLGADDGCGVASILAILNNKTIAHPNLECLITVSEEQGLTGATNLDIQLNANLLINLDSEDLETITIGSCGGTDVDLEASYNELDAPTNLIALQLHIKDLTSGHSGVEIHTKRASANKLLSRFLFNINKNYNITLAEINGKGVRNVIPMNASAIFLANKDDVTLIKTLVESLAKDVRKEFEVTEPTMNISVVEVSSPSKVMPKDFQNNLLLSYYLCINGVYKVSQHSDIIETSYNLGSFIVKEGKANVVGLARSSSESSLKDIVDQCIEVFAIAGFVFTAGNQYPMWEPKYDSELTKTALSVYKNLFNKESQALCIHAGLECSVIDKDNRMDKISIGPTMKEVHSPRERVNIKSVEQFQMFLEGILQAL